MASAHERMQPACEDSTPPDERADLSRDSLKCLRCLLMRQAVSFGGAGASNHRRRLAETSSTWRQRHAAKRNPPARSTFAGNRRGLRSTG